MLIRRCCLVFCLLLIASHTADAQVSKGHQILLNLGLQLQGLCQDDCYVTLSTYTNLNYTGFHWINSASGGVASHSSRPDWMGSAPGILPWGRWAWDETQMPPHTTPYGGDETPYLGRLMSICLGDEWNLNDDTIRTRLVSWFNSVRPNYPNALLYHNNWGSQIGDGALADFYTRAQPDMLCFDTYPWKSVWVANDTAGDAIPGPPTAWYGDLRRYREHAKGAGIPVGLYRQTFHAIQNYDATVYRDPSKSELRLNTFSALAFNVKLFNDFVYNTGAASLFTKTFNGSGDTVIGTNGLYAETADINKRARNFGRSLTGLKPVYDLHNPDSPNPPPGPASGNPNFPDGYTTSIMFLRGKTLVAGVTNFTALPNSFYPDPDSASFNPAGTGIPYSWWEFQKNDPYLNGWSVTNKGAIKNDGLVGEVILSWLTPLDESLDGTNYSNQVYMMVVNGLTAPEGTAADCLQEIKLNFSGLSGTMTNLLMLDPVSGQITTNSLPLLNTRRQLVLNLNGGDAALFKFNTGAPFVGFVAPTPAQLNAEQQATNINLSLKGALGARYELQTASSLQGANWTVRTNIVLTSSPYNFVDDIAGERTRYYRAAGIP